MGGIYEITTLVRERRRYRVEPKSIEAAIEEVLEGYLTPLKVEQIEPEAMQDWRDVTSE